MTSVTISAAPAHNEAPSADKERPEVHPGGFDQLGAREPLPDKKRHGSDDCADDQGRPVTGQCVLAVGVGVVQTDDRQSERDREQQATDHVDLFWLGAAIARAAG